MAMKRILTAEEHGKLGDTLKAEYKQDGDNYVLDLTDYEDPASAVRAKNHEKQARQAAEAKLKELNDSLTALTEERDNLLRGAIPKADVEKLETSYKTKFANREKELTGQITSMEAQFQSMLVDNVAQTLATEIFVSPAVGLPHIKNRLRAEKTADGKYETRILDDAGAPSAMTLADLKKNILANKDFAPIVVASKGSGGGANRGNGGGGAASGKVDFNKSPKEIAAALRDQGKIQADGE